MSYRIIASLLTLVLVCGSVQAKSNLADWGNVQKLSVGSNLLVATKKGEVFTGDLRQVDADTVTLLVRMSHSSRQAIEIRREDVSEVRKPRSHALMTALGLGRGLGVGIGIGAVYDSQHPFSDDPGIGKALYGGLGALVGTVGGRAIPIKGKKVYVSP